MDTREPTGECWFTVHTKPRQEHIAEQHLIRQGFDCYFPRAWNPSRKMPSESPGIEPLFPRYLFVRANPQVRSVASINYTRGVSRLVKFGTVLIQVPEWVINGLRRASDALSGLVCVDRASLKVGQPVEVFSGPCAGLRGVFQAPDGETRAHVLIELLGRENTLSVETRCLRAAR